jgi:hypothetical protein
MFSRRHFSNSIAGFCTYALLHEVRAAIPARSGTPAGRWISRQDELALGLTRGTISQIQWHDAVNALAKEVDVADLAHTIRRATTRSAGPPFGHDPQKRFISFRDENGNQVQRHYGAALFVFDSDSVITPHAHKHMASAHMVIEGKLRVRTFDRIKDESNALIVRPTADYIAEAGHASAMTSAKDNVHWFVPRSAHAMTLDVIVDGLDTGADSYEIQPIDPIAGATLADGTIRAPLISFEYSMQRYTATS